MGDLLHNGADSGDLAGADWDEDKMWVSLLIRLSCIPANSYHEWEERFPAKASKH